MVRKKHHSKKHRLHEELRQEAIVEFLGKQDEFHQKVYDEANTRFYKFLVGFIAIVLITLFISLSFLGPIDGVVQGHLRSSKMTDQTVLFGDYVVTFSDTVANLLPSLYEKNQIVGGVESAVCLLGSKEGKNIYNINKVIYPEIYNQSFGHVSFSSCPQETLIMFHTHPLKSCLASDTDLNTLALAQINNPNVLMIIMCEDFRYSVYS